MKIVLSVGQTDAIFCRNIVQHCWHLLRLVAFFSDETSQTDASIESIMVCHSTHVLVYIMTIMCYYGFVIGIMQYQLCNDLEVNRN